MFCFNLYLLVLSLFTAVKKLLPLPLAAHKERNAPPLTAWSRSNKPKGAIIILSSFYAFIGLAFCLHVFMLTGRFYSLKKVDLKKTRPTHSILMKPFIQIEDFVCYLIFWGWWHHETWRETFEASFENLSRSFNCKTWHLVQPYNLYVSFWSMSSGVLSSSS